MRSGQRRVSIRLVLFALVLITVPSLAHAGVERLYILCCGEGVAGDISRWSPGVNVGRPMDFVDTVILSATRRVGCSGIPAQRVRSNNFAGSRGTTKRDNNGCAPGKTGQGD